MVATPPEFAQGIAEFNQQQFYACHDTLEAVWVEAPEVDKRFYQGILQVAVGCYHLSNGNLRGAIILLGEAVRRLCDYQPDYQGVNVELLLNQAVRLLEALQQLETDQAEGFFQQLINQAKFANESDLENRLIKNCEIPHISYI